MLKAKTKFESALSREAAFLYNNLLLVALCLTVLWGVLFPIVTQLVKGESRTMGRPYYDFFLRAFGLPLLLLMGIGPLIAWRRTSVRSLLRTLAWPALASAIAGVVLVLVGAGSSRPGLIAYTFCAFVLGTIGLEIVRGTRATGSLFTLVAQLPPLRRLHRPRVSRVARDRYRWLERVQHDARGEAAARPDRDRRRLSDDVPGDV
jgi:cytochrome c-type biogenesis protein CcmF